MRKYLKNASALCCGIAALACFTTPSEAAGYYANNGSYAYYPYNNCCQPPNPCCYPAPCNPYCPPAPCNPCCPPPCNPCCTPPCDPCGPESCLWVKGEGLYTRACNSGLAFADLENRNTSNGLNFRDKFKHPHSEWKWGYRGTAGLRLCECWDLSASYTHLIDDAHGSAHTSRSEVAFPIYGFFINQFANIHAHYDLKIDYIDVNISRKFSIGDCVCIKPNFGAKLARIRQHYHIHNNLLTFPLPMASITESIHMENKYEGGGIKAGLDGIWGIGCGFSLVSSADGAILFGHKKFHFKEHEKVVQLSGYSYTQKSHFKDDGCACRYIADLAASLRWESSCGCIILGLEAGYEGHFFFNANNFVNELDVDNAPTLAQGSRSDLCVHGGRFAAYLRF